MTRIEASDEGVEDYLVEHFDAVVPDDYGPFISGLIDAATYLEQSMRHVETLERQIYPYILRTVRPDLVMAGLGVTDSVQHRMLAWAVPGNELYDPINAPKYWGYIQQSYEAADSMLASLWGGTAGGECIRRFRSRHDGFRQGDQCQLSSGDHRTVRSREPDREQSCRVWIRRAYRSCTSIWLAAIRMASSTRKNLKM